MHRVVVPGHAVDLVFGPHIPHPAMEEGGGVGLGKWAVQGGGMALEMGRGRGAGG